MLRSLGGSAPVVNAKPVRTREYSVELQSSGPATLPALYHNLHVVTVFLSAGTVVVRKSTSGSSWTRFELGESSIYAAGPGHRVEWPVGAHCLHMHLHPRLIRQVGDAMWNTPQVSLDVRARLRDPVIRDIGLDLYHMVRRTGSADPHKVHELIMALAHHVVGTYAAVPGPLWRIGRLSIEEVLDAFRDNVAHWNGVAALAKQAGLTRSHFARQVRRLTGLPPYVMVAGSRIEAAKALLERTEVSLSRVGYSAGFADQSHLTRAFQRAAGMTPGQYRAMRTRMGS